MNIQEQFDACVRALVANGFPSPMRPSSARIAAQVLCELLPNCAFSVSPESADASLVYEGPRAAEMRAGWAMRMRYTAAKWGLSACVLDECATPSWIATGLMGSCGDA